MREPWIHIIDRSKLDEVVAYQPKDKRSITRREDLTERQGHRSDVVLINGTRSCREYCLFVTADGFTGDLWILDMLNPKQYAQVQGIGMRMRQNAIDFPPAAKLIS